MRAKTIVLMLLSLTVLSSCACKSTIEYVDRVVVVEPVLPDIQSIVYPSVELRVWGDYAIYKAQCEAQIDICNSSIQSIINSIEKGQ